MVIQQCSALAFCSALLVALMTKQPQCREVNITGNGWAPRAAGALANIRSGSGPIPLFDSAQPEQNKWHEARVHAAVTGTDAIVNPRCGGLELGRRTYLKDARGMASLLHDSLLNFFAAPRQFRLEKAILRTILGAARRKRKTRLIFGKEFGNSAEAGFKNLPCLRS